MNIIVDGINPAVKQCIQETGIFLNYCPTIFNMFVFLPHADLQLYEMVATDPHVH